MSANNVVWLMRHIGLWHVFYSGCFDNTPKEPDYKDKYYACFKKKSLASYYAHAIVRVIDEECAEEGYIGVEYGVCEVPQEFMRKKGSIKDSQKIAELQIDIKQFKKDIDQFNKQIFELKEKFEKREEHQFQDYFKLQKFEEVLRALGKPLISALVILQAPDDRIADIEKALEKLDVGKTEKKDYKCPICQEFFNPSHKDVGFKLRNVSTNELTQIYYHEECYKASGGEKEDSARHIRPHSNLTEVKPAGNQSENSKPPEFKIVGSKLVMPPLTREDEPCIADPYYPLDEPREKLDVGKTEKKEEFKGKFYYDYYPIEASGGEKSDKNKKLVLGQTADKPTRSIVSPLSDSKPPRNCDGCHSWGQCDHQGAYQINGKWCYE